MSQPRRKVDETESTQAPWFRPPPIINKETVDLFTTYSGLQEDKVFEHVSNCRDKAWQIKPYPCVGMWAFLKPNIIWGQLNNEYHDILQRVKGGSTTLDMGCALAQDLRRLAADGAPTENMFATDLTREYWDLSFELFQDRTKMKAKFYCDDIFNSKSNLLRDLSGKIDIMISGDFLHLFDWDGQVEAASRMVQLGRPQAGTTVIGKQYGRNKPGPFATTFSPQGSMYAHNEETFARLWKEIGERTQTRWHVRTRTAILGEGGMWAPKEDFAWMGEETTGLQFVVTREDTLKAAS